MRVLTTLALLFAVCHVASANIVINGTRVIYRSSSKETTVQLINTGTSPSLVQSWIDDGDIDSTPETAHVPFLLTPPVIKVAGGGGQQLLIKKLPSSLPGDRESVFYLNVLDIPPVPENMVGKNTIQLAVKSRIKIFYRPQTLAAGADKGIELMRVEHSARTFTLHNASPYFITIANIMNARDNKLLKDPVMVAPFSTLSAPSLMPINSGDKYKLLYVDDLGAYKTHRLIP